MSMIRQLILAFALCSPALATPAQDALYDKVIAGDNAAVEKILADGVSLDEAPDRDPELQRELFKVFLVTDPRIEAFTADWLQKEPGSAYAMTARGWYLVAMGRANRGGDWISMTYRDGLDRMNDYDTAALNIFTDATKAAPRLLSASDGLIRLTQSVAPKKLIVLELERIMALHPNRGSLMRAMYTLAPQWGGNMDEVGLVCGRYAPLITSIKDYTPKVCEVDAVYFGSFAKGDARDAASIALQGLQNPVLDYARLEDVLDRKGTPAHWKDVLNKIKTERPLTPEEGLALDNAYIAVNHVGELANYREALLLNQDQLRIAADRDPLSSIVVMEYIDWLKKRSAEHDIKYDIPDARARLKRVLTAIPFSWRAWRELANLSRGDEIGTMERVRGYSQNSIYYSNYAQEALQSALSTMVAQTDLYSKRKYANGNYNLAPDDVAELDRLGKCPIVALTRLTLAACAERDISSDQCLAMAYMFLLKPMLEDVEARGVCQTETNAPLASLMLGPVPADF